jgi:hypothetical protein
MVHMDAIRVAEVALKSVAQQIAADQAALENERAKIKQWKTELEEEQALMKTWAEQQRGAVTLDVGGTSYKTSRPTLTKVKGSRLEAMFSGRNEHLLERDAEGKVFSDRDGDLFGHVLNFLRGSASHEDSDALSEGSLHALRREAQYFGVEAAMFPEDTPGQTPELNRLFVFGGSGDDDHQLDTTEVLDPASMSFVPGPRLARRRAGCACAPCGSGRLLLAGGSDGAEDLNSTEVLNLRTQTFEPGPDMEVCRPGCALVPLGRGKIMAVGGSEDVTRLDTTEVLDVKTMTFTPGPRMTEKRNRCTAVFLPGSQPQDLGADEGWTPCGSPVDTSSLVGGSAGAGRALVIGGFDGVSDLDSTEILDVATMVFSPGPNLESARYGCCCVLLPIHRPPRCLADPLPVCGGGSSLAEGYQLLVCGGSDGATVLSSTEILDLSTMTFSSGPCMGSGPRVFAAAAPIDEGRILVLGGSDDDCQLETTEVLDVAAMTFSPGPKMRMRRESCAAHLC